MKPLRGARKSARPLTVPSAVALTRHRLMNQRSEENSIGTSGEQSVLTACAPELDVQYKTAFVLAHKLREAVASSMKALRIGGEGRIAEIDGAYFGGHVRPENLAADRIDRRLVENQSGQTPGCRRDARARRPHAAEGLSAEEAAVPAIRQRINKGTVVHAYESPAWNKLRARFAMQRSNHQDGYRYHGAG